MPLLTKSPAMQRATVESTGGDRLQFTLSDLTLLVAAIAVPLAASIALGWMSIWVWAAAPYMLYVITPRSLVGIGGLTAIRGIGWGVGYGLFWGVWGMFADVGALMLNGPALFGYGIGWLTLAAAVGGFGFGLIRSIVYTINVLRDPV